MPTLQKKPGDALDYRFDWAPLANGRGISDWLQPGEQIASYVVSVESGLNQDSVQLVDGATAVVVWLSGGTPGKSYVVSCEITTTSIPARVASRTFDLRIIAQL